MVTKRRVWVLVAWFLRYSSAASLASAAAAPLIYLMGDRGPWYTERSVLLAIFMMSVLLVVRHRENIVKLMQGKESKLGFGKKGNNSKVPEDKAAAEKTGSKSRKAG